jgi:hypothetical protein
MPGTFREWAKPGEDIHNYDDNIRVSQRIVKSYHDRWGGDPERVAVAYYSGPGNVAPLGSTTPWKRNIRPGNAPSVSQYVAQVTGRMKEDPLGRVAWESGLTKVPPSTPEGRAYYRAPEEGHDPDQPFKDMVRATSSMAPRGIHAERMRRSENIEDVRQPAETGGVGDDPSGAGGLNLAIQYLRGNISERDFKEAYPKAGELSKTQLAKELGIEDIEKIHSFEERFPRAGEGVSESKELMEAMGRRARAGKRTWIDTLPPGQRPFPRPRPR